MQLQVTNKGPAVTVDFLAVFNEGETKTFNATEIELYQSMSGVPLYSGPLTDEDKFEVVVLSDKDGEEG